MQYRSPPQERGSVLAALNFLVFSGILLAGLALCRPAASHLSRFAGQYRSLHSATLGQLSPDAGWGVRVALCSGVRGRPVEDSAAVRMPSSPASGRSSVWRGSPAVFARACWSSSSRRIRPA